MSVGLTLESKDSGSDSRSVVSSSALDKLEFELEQETYRMIEFEATTTPAAAAASSDMGHDGDKSSESDSICTTVVQPPPMQRAGEFESQAGIGESLAPDHLPQLTRSTASDDQILSARNLIFGARRNESEDGEEIYHEIELSDERPVAARLFDANQLRAGEMFATYRQQDEDLHPDALASQRQQQQQQKPAPGMHQFRCNGGGVGGGFCEAQPKITFASRRVKEYFKSFKSHKGETVRLYQFFKSTRTELVACLLFSLITSQALIVLRTHLIDEGAAAAGATWPLLNPSTRRQLEALQDNIEPPARHTKESQQTFHEQQQQQQQHHHLYHQRGQISNSNGRPAAPHGNGSPGSGRPASVQLANGLVMAFTVASLTQIFGHISGCHLIPSVSLALYVKGHISRARLASYLAAQLLGSALGVSLLSLLSSSQLTPADYRDLLVQPAGSSAMTARYQQQQQRPWSSQLAATDSVKLLAPSRRRRRDAVFEPQKIDNNNATASDHDEPRGSPGGSETILLSIMEQLERQQRPSSGGQVAHRRQQQQLASGEQPTSTIANEDYDDKRRVAPAAPITTSSGPGLEQETITVNVNTFPSDNLERRQQINLVEAPRAPPESSSSSSSSSSLETRAPASSAAATTTTAATMITTTIADDTTTTPRTVEVVAAGTSSSLPASSLLSDAAAAAGWNYSEPVEVARIRSGNEPPPPSFFNDRSRVVSPAIVAEPQAYGDGQQQQQHSDTIERLSVKAAAANNNDSSALADRGPWSGSAGDSPQPESTGQIAAADSTSVASSRRPKLRRRKRNRQHLSAPSAVTQPPSVATTDNDATEKAPPQFSSSGSGTHERLLLLAHDRKSSDHYINLLEFTLPDQIMSSESIRQCIDKQLASAALATNQSFGATGTGSEQQQLVASAASNSFHRCISLSNSSQMFVFQFVATLLVVLAYLVNVDPRRVDPGFKSLSIGLSYFVASVVTIQSGGFYANPFQLIFLSWLSSTSEWQPEWFIYLITPLIGGLFGAISHEYIDFSSLRNRNKRLHLRRSFYSLDQLASGQQLDSTPMACRQQQPQPKPPQNVNASETQHAAAAAGAADSSRLTCPGAVGSARQLSSGSSLESAGASSSVLSLSSQHELQQAASCEQVTSHSRPQHQGSSSLAASHPQPQPQPRTVVAMPSTGAECFNGATTSRKLARYPRHHHRANYRSNGHLTSGSSSSPPPPSMVMMISKHEQADVTSLRRSDFDSNFLISSTTATQASSSSSPSPPPPATASRRQGAQQTTTNSNWM